MPPASAVQGIIPNTDRGLNLSLQLGTEYERKKQRLLQELQLDYKHYVTKKKDVKMSERRPPAQGLSLPIDENLSEKEKLREERKKEYNLFLQEKAQTRRLKRRTPSVTATPAQIQRSPAAALLPPLNTNANITTPPPRAARPASRRDAATLTEAENRGRSRRTWDRRQRRRRQLLLCRPIEAYSSEEEEEEEEEEAFTDEEERKKNSPQPESKEGKSMRERREKRAPKEAEASRVRDHNNNDLVVNLKQPESMKLVRRSPATGKDTAEFATGLLIGAEEEQTASQMRKEQYKQELLKQIAEEQRNKMKEKKLELRVAATGAKDPEKQPERIKQFGGDLEAAVKEPDLNKKKKKPLSENTEQRTLPRKSQVETTGNTAPGSGTDQSLPSLDYFNQDYHREMSNMLREVTVPRIAGVPPPVAPTVTNNYTTPYDAAYYYYGARNPLDPNPPHYQNDSSARVQESASLHASPQEPPPPPPLKAGHRSEVTDLHGPSSSSSSPLQVSELPVDEAKQRRENALSYQEALRQQIKEREECKRREKEERERYDAKIEAEMTAYNPWGRSGGGAPIKDQKGNLFSDLHQMHRSNKESFKNHQSENDEQTQNLLKTNGDAHEVEGKAAFSHRLSALNDPPKPQQLRMQDRYKEDLKQQIEENKRLQAEERERLRIEEEKEERRLTEQRIRMQREYEQEQRKQKKIENKTKNQSWTNEPQTRRQEEEKTVRREDKKETRPPLIYERESSPPVPALQRRQTNAVASRASSAASQLSSAAVSRRSVSAPHYPSGPGRTAPLQDGHHEVIRQLSALRRVLRKEQKELEGQMDKRDGLQHSPPHRSRRQRSPAVDAFESARRDTDEPSTAKTYSVSARVDMQNIREFNQLKYRETASREEVLHMFPDPPTDAQSLDIQQQALLREQRRRIRLMKGEEDGDLLDLELSRYYPRIKPERRVHKDSILPSETAFMDVYSDDVGEEQQERTPSPPPRRGRDNDISTKDREHDVHADALSLQLHSAPEVRGQDKHRTLRRRDSDCDDNRKSDRLIGGGGEEDALSLSSVLEGGRVSVDTVATEPWLRPGTSSAVVKRSAWERAA